MITHGTPATLACSSEIIKDFEIGFFESGAAWLRRGQALERKLVDELGGLDAGARKARQLAGLKDDAPVREARAPKRMIPPLADAIPAGGWLGYLLEGLTLLSRAPALAVMEYLPTDLA